MSINRSSSPAMMLTGISIRILVPVIESVRNQESGLVADARRTAIPFGNLSNFFGTDCGPMISAIKRATSPGSEAPQECPRDSLIGDGLEKWKLVLLTIS